MFSNDYFPFYQKGGHMKKLKVEDLENISFYQLPKWLMKMFTKNIIGVGGFKTYILMYDRLRLSSKNDWIDENGEIYIKYSYEDIMKDLDCNSKTTVSNNIKELEKLGLIAKIKCFRSSNIYYLTIKGTEDDTITVPYTSQSTETYTDSSIENCTHLSTDKTYTSNNNYINNNSSKNNFNKNKLLEQVEKANISLELKGKLAEFISYRIEIKKPIKSFRVISNLLTQIGKRFLNESHLVESIDMSISCGYQGIFPTKILKKKDEQESYNTMMLKKLEDLDGGKNL